MSLISYTEKGVAAVKESPKRAGDFRQLVADAGGNILGIYWSLGAYDGCLLFETPDAEIGTAVLLRLSQLGNVRTETMQIFDESEFKAILQRS